MIGAKVVLYGRIIKRGLGIRWCLLIRCTISFGQGITVRYSSNVDSSYVPAIAHGNTLSPASSSSTPGNAGLEDSIASVRRIAFRENAMFWPGGVKETSSQRPAL